MPSPADNEMVMKDGIQGNETEEQCRAFGGGSRRRAHEQQSAMSQSRVRAGNSSTIDLKRIGGLSQLTAVNINKGKKEENEVARLSPTLRPRGLWPTRLLRPWDSPGKNTGVGCHFLLQGIFLTQGSNPGLPHCRQTLPSEPRGA